MYEMFEFDIRISLVFCGINLLTYKSPFVNFEPMNGNPSLSNVCKFRKYFFVFLFEGINTFCSLRLGSSLLIPLVFNVVDVE